MTARSACFWARAAAPSSPPKTTPPRHRLINCRRRLQQRWQARHHHGELCLGPRLSGLLGTGTGTFPTHQDFAGGGLSVAVGDFNRDRYPDLAVAGNGVSVLLNAADWPGTGLANRLAVSGFPSPDTAGTAGSFAVTVKNADGTTATNYAGTVHFTSSDPQAVLPADYTFTAADAGIPSAPP